MYVLFSGKHHIFLNSRLKGWKLRHVMFHELAHYLFHAPSQSNMAVEFFSVHAKEKNHREAEAAAAWLLVTPQMLPPSTVNRISYRPTASCWNLRIRSIEEISSMSRSVEGSIYKTPDKSGWFARLRYTDNDGIRREKKRTCKTHGLAKTKLKELRHEIERDLSDRKTYRELDQFFRSEYLHEAKYANGLKISGFRQNLKIIERYLDIALEHFGDVFIEEISYGDLEAFKLKVANTPTIQERQRSMADVNQTLRRVRRLFSVAVEQGWLAVNPFTRGKDLFKCLFSI
jgi:Zn-dependent peptidase ImmA (M78 family)